MTKIVYVITSLSTGGAEMMLYKLLQHLDRARFEPVVFSMTDKGEIGPLIEALGVSVIALGMRRGVPNPAVVWRLTRYLRRIQPDVVHTWMYHADLLGGAAARLAGCRRVAWGIRQANLSRTENKRSTLIVVQLCAWLSPWLPTQILSCSNRAKSEHAKIGYLNEKIQVIPNGFNLERFQPDPAARQSVRSELNLDPDTPLVGLIARFDVQKNQLGFVEAAASVRMQMPGIHFILAGTGVNSDNRALQSAVSKSGLQSHMHLLGRRDDIPRLMAALDVLASSSHGEAFPNVLGEAMACGVPCAVTDAGDSAEIVGDTGRVVATGDMAALARNIAELLRLPKAAKLLLGRQARQRVRDQYEIAHVTALYQDFYEQLLVEK